MINTCRSRECREGWLGRRRHYLCRVCGRDFIHDGLGMPEKARICMVCLQEPENHKIYDQAIIEFQERALAQGLIP